MDNSEIYTQLTDIFHEMFANDDIVLTSKTTAKDVEGWDSFVHLSLIVAVETRLGIKFAMSQIDKLASVGDLVAAIAALKA
jgi:acyl carrier protein